MSYSLGVYIGKDEKTEGFTARIGKALVRYLKKINNSESLDSYHRLSILWDGYSKESNKFDFEFHPCGSMGTSGRLKTEQILVKKRIEILIDYMYGYYELYL